MRELAEIFPRISNRPHIVITMGKGGVGKTTISIVLGLLLSTKGRVLVASLDPAQHLREYLKLPHVGRDHQVYGDLWAIQYDIDIAAKRLAEDYAIMVKRLLPGLTSLNIDNIVDALRDAPGFEEEVFLRLLSELYQRNYDYIVIDTPPTGIALRVLRLPSLYEFWLEQLTRIRERIVSLRYTISRVLGKPIKPSDPVLDKLYQLREKYHRLNEALRDREKTSLVIVATPEPLPVYEAQAVVQKLEPQGILPRLFVLNRYLGSKAIELGIGDVEKTSLDRLEKLRCSIGTQPPLLIIGHAGFAPRSLDDARRLLNHILELRTVCETQKHVP